MSEKHAPDDPILAALEAKVAAWQAAVDSYKIAVSHDGPASDQHVPSTTDGRARHVQPAGAKPVDLPVGVFRDKTIKEAIVIYLGAGRRKQTNKEIAVGLQKGGIATTAANFEATVATALYRLKEEGTILRFGDGWDLAASYPGNLRNRLKKDAKPRRASTTKKTKGRKRGESGAVAKATAPTVAKIPIMKLAKSSSDDAEAAS